MKKDAIFNAYLDKQSEEAVEGLKILRDCIFEAVPEAEEKMNYGVPAYALIPGGKRDQQVMIGGFKKHVAIYPYPTTIEYFAEDLKAYKQGKGSVQFPFDTEIPRSLIVDMVRYHKKHIEFEME